MSIDNKKQPTIQKITGIDILKPEQIFLDNGIPVNVIRMGDTAVTRLDLIFEGGRCDEPRPMISDFVSALMREGTFSKSAEEIADSLDYYGSWMGSETSSHNTTLSVYSLNKHFNKIIPVFTDIATAPAFSENKLENLKDVAITRLNNNRQKVTYLASSEFQKRYYGENHNLGKHPEETTIRNINRNDLLNFHKKRIHPANAKIVISGMVDKDILNVINHNLGQIPSTTRHSQSASDKPAIEFHPDKIFVEKKVDRKNKDTALIGGDDVSVLSFSGVEKAYKVILMHGAKAVIRLYNYAVVKIENAGNCWFEVENEDNTGVVL